MRVARVLYEGRETLALERNGVLYSVRELEKRFGVPAVLDGVGGIDSFRTRVFSLGLAGLARLDDLLLGGDRPTEARLDDARAMRLAPTVVGPAVFRFDAVRAGRPSYDRVDGRGLRGSGATVDLPEGEDEPDVEASVAAIVGDDLRGAGARDADRAIAGFCVWLGWSARRTERALRAEGRGTGEALDVEKQAGPVLVTREEAGEMAGLGVRVRVRGVERASATLGDVRAATADLVAWASRRVTLAPGDLVVPGPAASLRPGYPLGRGEPVEVEIDRLGCLRGATR